MGRVLPGSAEERDLDRHCGSADVYMYHTFSDGHCDGAVSTANTVSHQTLHPAYLSP